MPGIPLLFTDSAGPLTVRPFPGLYAADNLYAGEGVFLDEGPGIAFDAPVPAFVQSGTTVTVTPLPVTFSAATPVLIGGGAVVFTVGPSAPVTFSAVPPVSLTGTNVVVQSTPLPVTFNAPVPQTSGGMLLILIPSVRELPPLRLSHVIETPSGRFFRWGEDDPNPARVPSGVRFSDTMPGGFENADATLPRKAGEDDADFERLSTWHIYGAGGEKAWEGRIERAPRVSGNESSVSPSAVGWQAHLEDDKSAREIYVDRDLSHWGPWSRQRQVDMNAVQYFEGQGSIETLPDATTKVPGISHKFERIATTAGSGPFAVFESWYDGHGIPLGLMYLNQSQVGINVNPSWTVSAQLHVDDRGATPGSASTGNLQGAPGPRYLSNANPALKFGLLQTAHSGTFTGDIEVRVDWKNLTMYGNHGLTGYGPDPNGLLASDIVAHVVGKFAPQLTATTGTNGSIQTSGFVVPHLVFMDRTTAGDMVKQTARFGLWDFAVWDNKTFWWHDRNARGRAWRTRIGPAQFEESGPSFERVWNSLLVQYQDVDGSTRTVGPPGSGSDTEDVALVDLDPENPANSAGVIRRTMLTMGVSTPAAATTAGQRFLQESKLLDRSGRARILGHIESDRGVVFPYWAVRAGDTISFIDAADSSPRRVIRTEKDHASRTCSVDLDAPPEGLQQLLERAGVGIVDLGFQ